MSQNAIAASLGVTKSTVSRIRGDVVSRPLAPPLELLLVKGVTRTSFHFKNRLIAAGLKDNRCEICGIAHWLDRPLVMALHRVNGDNIDNRLENLQVLCPNCHSQTESFSGRNKKRDEAVRAGVGQARPPAPQ